jgi:hypothetical protein
MKKVITKGPANESITKRCNFFIICRSIQGMQKYLKFGNYMEENIKLTDDEFSLLSQKEFFIIKKDVTGKLMSVFGELNRRLEEVSAACRNNLPAEIFSQSGKISKGENYKGFPWMVLDHPRCFNRDDVFAYRSMCWWGNEISFTLHLSGKYKMMISDLPGKIEQLRGKDYYICINDTPWHYHFEADNYLKLDEINNVADVVYQHPFLKISKQIPLEKTLQITEYGTKTFAELMRTLFAD